MIISRTRTDTKQPNSDVRGPHTALIAIFNKKLWESDSRIARYFSPAGGPPFAIIFGSRNRVEDAYDALALRDAIVLDEIVPNLTGRRNDRERVPVIVGTYSFNGYQVPILLASTEMGFPPTQIYVREIAGYSCTAGYTFNGKKLGHNGTIIVRVGTSGGLLGKNSADPTAPWLESGDLVVAENHIARADAIASAVNKPLGTMLYSKIARVADALKGLAGKSHFEEFVREFLSYDDGFKIINVGGFAWAKTRSTPSLVDTLFRTGQAIMGGSSSPKIEIGNAVSKDYLYTEHMSTHLIHHLHDDHGCKSTEMEGIMLNLEGAKINMENSSALMQTGAIYIKIGPVPGEGYPTCEQEERMVAAGERAALVVAAASFVATEHGYGAVFGKPA